MPFAKRASISSPTATAFASVTNLPSETRFTNANPRPSVAKGLTVFNAAGQWRDQASNKIMREPSKVVQIVLPGQVEDIARLNEIVEAYKRCFRQQSVGMIVRPACVSF